MNGTLNCFLAVKRNDHNFSVSSLQDKCYLFFILVCWGFYCASNHMGIFKYWPFLS